MCADILPFADKVALVTGSSRGIGRAIALHFASLGADLVVHCLRKQGAAEETAAAIRAFSRRALVVKADLSEQAGLELLFHQIDQAFGGLDFLIHSAATGYNRPVMEQRPKGWDWTMNVNARALLFAAQRAASLMRRRGGGAIVALSSPGALRVLPAYVLVGASKAALEALVRYLAVELAPDQIVVNAVSPGLVLTDALQHFESMRQDDRLVERIIARTPAGRLATPAEVAGVVAFLCSPAAAMIRGQVILMDGGYTLPASLLGEWPGLPE
jgi:enoyl-[acyl-carrier protein] reductase III